MPSPALLVFAIPVVAGVLGLRWYGYLFEKSVRTERIRDFIASVAVLTGSSFAIILLFMFSSGLYLQLT